MLQTTLTIEISTESSWRGHGTIDESVGIYNLLEKDYVADIDPHSLTW